MVTHCQIRLFADDTCLFIEVDNRDTTAELINSDLEEIQTWANKWLVTFSPPKTKSLIISNKNDFRLNPSVNLNGHAIDEVDYLGLKLFVLKTSAVIDAVIDPVTSAVTSVVVV